MIDADTAADAFGVLSDPSRVAILRELTNRVYGGREPNDPVSFVELRHAVGVSDAGRFNYHLGKLRDRFVVKRGDGYAPTYAGVKAIGSIESGVYTNVPEAREEGVDYDCPECGSALTAAYDRHGLSLSCDDHGDVLRTHVPPSVAAESSLSDIVAFVNSDMQRDMERHANGACVVCDGPTEPTAFEREDGGQLLVAIDCQSCWLTTWTPIDIVVVRHPAVVSLYYDHGIDIRSEPLFSLDFVRATENTEFVSRNPVEVELVVEVAEDAVTLRVDENLNVTEI